MVDYSKFDKLAAELSDSESAHDSDFEDDTHEESPTPAATSSSSSSPLPHVTRLDGKTSVTFGGGQTTPSYTTKPKPSVAAPIITQKSPMPTTTATADLTRNGGEIRGDGRHFYWSQTKESVTIHFEMVPAVKGKDVEVRLNEARLRVTICGEVLCDEDMVHRSVADSGQMLDEIEVEDVDWELLTHNTSGARLLRISFAKFNPPGTVAWWTKVFHNDREISLESIPDRSLTKAAETKKVWEEAHRMFQEKMKTKTPIAIDEV